MHFNPIPKFNAKFREILEVDCVVAVPVGGFAPYDLQQLYVNSDLFSERFMLIIWNMDVLSSTK